MTLRKLDRFDWPLDRVSVEIAGMRLAPAIDASDADRRWLTFDCTLSLDSATIVTLHTLDVYEPRHGLENEDKRRLGLRVGDIVLAPIAGPHGLKGVGMRLVRSLRSLWRRGRRDPKPLGAKLRQDVGS